MKKSVFLAKQGFSFKLISILIQNLIISPLLFIISFILTAIIIGFNNIETTLLLKIIFIILNIIWAIRNSLVVLVDNKIVVRNWIGTKQIIEIDNITDLRIISYKELRHIIFNTTSLNPLISNCAAFFIPAGKFITFKNRFGRDVVVGVWNYKKMYEIINNGLLSDSVNEFVCLKQENNTNIKINSESLYTFYLKMPLNMHIETFFRNFYKTILFPLFISLISMWLFSLSNVSVNKFICIALFFLASFYECYRVIRVVVNTELKIVKLNLFSTNNKNVIKYGTLYNLECTNSIKASEMLKNNKFRFCIATPYYPNGSDNIIKFELNNNIVVLSVNKPQKLYDLLRDSENQLLK